MSKKSQKKFFVINDPNGYFTTEYNGARVEFAFNTDTGLVAVVHPKYGHGHYLSVHKQCLIPA